ncbi:MAG TPA: Wadjet anti-phage system protein JetD domain-containing protein, partial [Prosthecobacter sp.]
PLMWKAPEETGGLLDLVFRFTSEDWGANVPVRTASSALGIEGGSKGLEPRKAVLETCLCSLFGRPVTLESSGIVLTDPSVEMAGELILHFLDGREQAIHSLRGIYSLSLLNDLDRVSHITTAASRILLIENKKTSLPLLAARNDNGSTLLLTCSFPNRAVLRLLELLPSALPVYHFGDTDPAGFLILAKIREQTGRSIVPFLMHYRQGKALAKLTEYDRRVLPGLLKNRWLEDVQSELEKMHESQDKGMFEQETWGMPDLPGWPFYTVAIASVD